MRWIICLVPFFINLLYVPSVGLQVMLLAPVSLLIGFILFVVYSDNKMRNRKLKEKARK